MNLVVVLVALVYLFPTLEMRLNRKDKPELWPHKQINLGLDLQGGMHLALEVDAPKAVEGHMERLIQELRLLLRKENIRNRGIAALPGAKASVNISGEDLDRFNTFLDREFPDLHVETEETEGLTRFILSLPEAEAKYLEQMAVDQALETIRNRIDAFGVSEPDIRRQGDNRLLIQLPGIKDPSRAKALIGKTALLEFRLVDEDHDVNAALKGDIPAGSELMYQTVHDPETNRMRKTPFLIKKRTALTGADLTDARVQINQQYNEPYVSIRFNKKGARQFGRITGENINKRLAIVLDNNVYSAPVIKSEITGGDAMIEGSFTEEEARDLAIVLRAGALPAPVKVLEERTVGPSLGQDSIQRGLISGLIGGLLVVIFMAVYYKGAGLIADAALIINIILIAGGLSAFQATLTLPGIAGIILTIGMAVDANVLIFERIREELKLGKTPRAAVAAGFERATITILDSNITTLIAALVLFQFGTGPVKGFAVTLSLGVVSSVFTALVFSRLVFDYFLINRGAKTISI
ncbi:MAG: protein translocase subunit SecD [Thermodesulfobacteriota bacterium]